MKKIWKCGIAKWIEEPEGVETKMSQRHWYSQVKVQGARINTLNHEKQQIEQRIRNFIRKSGKFLEIFLKKMSFFTWPILHLKSWLRHWLEEERKRSQMREDRERKKRNGQKSYKKHTFFVKLNMKHNKSGISAILCIFSRIISFIVRDSVNSENHLFFLPWK